MDLLSYKSYALVGLMVLVLWVISAGLSAVFPIGCATNADGYYTCLTDPVLPIIGSIGTILIVVWSVLTILVVYKEFFKEIELNLGVRKKSSAKKRGKRK
jgi:hypothetical protein